MIKLYIVIAVYNRKEITLNCLKQLKKQHFKQFKVIIVDDGSTDGTFESISVKYPEVRIIRGLSGDWWWTKCVNKGINQALEEGATHLLLLNDDTSFEEDYIENIFLEIKKEPNAIIGSLNLTTEYPPRAYFTGVKALNKITFKYTRYQKTLSSYNTDAFPAKIYKSIYLPARGLLVPTLVFKKIGLLDEINFPQYFSDVDFTLRAYEHNIPQYLSHNMVLKTPLESTGSGDLYKGDSLSMFLRSFKNPYSKRHLKTSYLFIKKHVPSYYLYISFLFYQIRIILSFIKARSYKMKN